MASGFKSSGVDLDQVFQAYVSGPRAAATGFRQAGQDLSQRYQAYHGGPQAPATGYRVQGVDLNQRFSPPFAVSLSGGIAHLQKWSGPVTTGWQFRPDGRVHRLNLPGNPFERWLTVGPAALFLLRARKVSGTTPSGAALNVSHPLSHARYFQLTTDKLAKVCQLRCELTLQGSSTILASALYTIEVELSQF